MDVTHCSCPCHTEEKWPCERCCRGPLDARLAALTAALEKVKRLRNLQRVYFKFRTQDVLIEAKTLEREVDADLAALDAAGGA